MTAGFEIEGWRRLRLTAAPAGLAYGGDGRRSVWKIAYCCQANPFLPWTRRRIQVQGREIRVQLRMSVVWRISLPPIVATFVVLWGSIDGSFLESERGGDLLPQGRTTDIPWLGINQFQVRFSEQTVLTRADVRVQSARGVAYGPVKISGFSDLYTITLARPIEEADRVRVLIDIPRGTPFSGTLNVLPGDVNDDGVVNSKDLAAIHKQPHVYWDPPSVLYQDITGDGEANGSDYRAVKGFLGTMLPWPFAKAKRLDAVLDRAAFSLDNKSVVGYLFWVFDRCFTLPRGAAAILQEGEPS